MDIKALTELCQGRRVWIQTHNYPDPDAIASALGLQELLGKYGIYASLCHDGEIDKLSSSKMLVLLDVDMCSSYEIHEQMAEKDMIILVDCQKNSGNTTDFIGDEQAVIDHHPTFVREEYAYTDLRITGACASIIAEYYKESGYEPSERVATALAYGIKMDTHHFRRGVTKFDIEMYSYLHPYVNVELMHAMETNNLELKDLKAYGSAIRNIQVIGRVGFSYMEFECPDALVAILSDFILSLAEVELVVMYAKRRGGYKFSIRSEITQVNAGELANAALSEWGNGGGHAEMAGGFARAELLPTDNEELFETVQKRFMDVLSVQYEAVIL